MKPRTSPGRPAMAGRTTNGLGGTYPLPVPGQLRISWTNDVVLFACGVRRFWRSLGLHVPQLWLGYMYKTGYDSYGTEECPLLQARLSGENQISNLCASRQ
jgi:hypothetical protein